MTLYKTPRRNAALPLALRLFSMALVATLCVGPTAGCKMDRDTPSKTSDDDGDEEEKDDDDEDVADEGDEPTVNAPDRGGNRMGIAEDGEFMVDSGFRPSKHGLVFPNGDRDESGRRKQYPGSSDGFLDVDGMQRLFGTDNVCLGEGEKCVLSPGAREFMHMANKVMNRGQCEGMAVFALSMFNGLDSPDYFKDGAEFASELKRDDTRAAVGYYFSFQFLQPMRNDLFGRMKQTTPAKVLDQVADALKSKEDMVALEFIQPGKGGHAVVPYAIEDVGNDVYRIRIWDNNFPKVSRFIEIDKGKNTWKYSFAAINPNEDTSAWGGGAFPNTIVATPVSLRMRDMVCPFCEKKDQKSRMFMVAGNSVNATITDEQGRSIGWKKGKMVNEIPGAEVMPVLSFVPGEGTPEAMYTVPADHDYDISLDSDDGDDDVSVGVFGDGKAVVVENIKVDKKQTDHLVVKKSGLDLDYKPATSKTAPSVRLAVGSGKDAYQVKLDPKTVRRGQPLKFRLNPTTLEVDVKAGDKPVPKLKFRVARFDRSGKQSVATNADAPQLKQARLQLKQLKTHVEKDAQRFVRRRLKIPTAGSKKGLGPTMTPSKPSTKTDAPTPQEQPKPEGPDPKNAPPKLKLKATPPRTFKPKGAKLKR